MSWLWIAIIVAIFSGYLYAFGRRLQATALWVGKALVPSECTDTMPRGLQDAIMVGWPHLLGYSAFLPFFAAAVGFIHSWWASIISFILSLVTGILAGNIHLVPTTLDWYLEILSKHVKRRGKKYLSIGDSVRAETANKLAQDIDGIIEIYINTGIQVPDMMDAVASGHGNPRSLLRQ